MRLLFALLLNFNQVYAVANHDHQQRHHDENKSIAISGQAIQRNQIKVMTAGPKTIQITREVLGKIVPNANRTIYVYPRYNGIIHKLTKQLGDQVDKGETLATIESDQTLQTYTITAQ